MNTHPAYEVGNPSFPYLTLKQQIEHGVNDWIAFDDQARSFYGETREKAEAARAAYQTPAAFSIAGFEFDR